MELTELRASIDRIDNQLVQLLEERMDVAENIAAYKAAAGLPVLDQGRELEKLTAVRDLCRPETSGVINDVFEAILAASRAYQTALMDQSDD